MCFGPDGGGVMTSVLNRIFQCSHRRQSRPITPRGGGQTYAVCLDWGTRLAYDSISKPLVRSVRLEKV